MRNADEQVGCSRRTHLYAAMAATVTAAVLLQAPAPSFALHVPSTLPVSLTDEAPPEVDMSEVVDVWQRETVDLRPRKAAGASRPLRFWRFLPWKRNR